MFPTVLIQTLKNIIDGAGSFDWDYPSEVMEKIAKELGWEYNTDFNSSGCGMCISVCGNYILKHNYMSGRSDNHPAAIPTEVIASQERNGWGYYVFSLQPKADISLAQMAYEKLKQIYARLPDGKISNCAFWNGQPVLIDW